MRTRTILVGLLAATGLAAAAPTDPKQADPDDLHVTITEGRGRFGLVTLQISPDLRKHLGAPDDRGVLVDSVRVGSPAERAGLKVGDVITSVDGDPVLSANDMLDAIADRKRGDLVPVMVSRGMRDVTMNVKLEDDPGPQLRGRFDAKGWERFAGAGDAPFDFRAMFDDRGSQRKFDELRRRLDELEHRIDRLGTTPRRP